MAGAGSISSAYAVWVPTPAATPLLQGKALGLMIHSPCTSGATTKVIQEQRLPRKKRVFSLGI